MISLLPPQVLPGRSVNAHPGAQQSASEENALEKGMEEKIREFTEAGAKRSTEA